MIAWTKEPGDGMEEWIGGSVGHCYPVGDPGCGEKSLSELERHRSWPQKKDRTSHEDDELRWLLRQEREPLSGPRERSNADRTRVLPPPLSATQGGLPIDGCIHVAIEPIQGLHLRGSKCVGTNTLVGSASAAADRLVPPRNLATDAPRGALSIDTRMYRAASWLSG